MQAKWIWMAIAALGSSSLASATDLTLHLRGTQPITRKTVQYQCDAKGTAMGLPAGIFAVEYVNGAGNSLVIIPINGMSMIFANVTSGSGARYAASQYIWWDAAGGVNFYSDSLAGKMQSACHRMNAT
jgi:membrane-bound inhibitor of C-type lysozyme